MGLGEHRRGKRTLHAHAVELKLAPIISARELTKLLENMSRSLLPSTCAGTRALEKWEQGGTKPDARAAQFP